MYKEARVAFGPFTNVALAWLGLETTGTTVNASVATVTLLSIEAQTFVPSCSPLSGASITTPALSAYTGCRCTDNAFPILWNNSGVNFTTGAQCVSSCAIGQWLCHGRGRSDGVTFFAASDLTTVTDRLENISECVLLTEITIVNTNFDWNTTYNAYMNAKASVLQGVLTFAETGKWR